MVIDDTLSDPLTIYSGVPQGGVIGHLLFLNYINDINLNNDIKSDMSLFAGDSKIFSESNISLQSTLDNMYKWPKTRKLYLYPNNCKILTVKKNKPFDPLINNTKIPTVKIFKNLGIYISENL